jgi:hypothetical protein
MVRPVWMTTSGGSSSWLRSEDFRFPFALFVFGRIALLASSYIGLTLVNTLYDHDAGRQQYLQPYRSIDGLCRWDCAWFLNVSREGYSTLENAKVFPLFPMLANVGHRLTGIHELLILLFISNLCSLLSYFVIFRMFRELAGSAAARWALMMMAAYPFAFFQAAAYPESAMILASAFALHLSMRRHYLTAGNVLGLGIMARHVTIFGGAGMLLTQLQQARWSPRRFLFENGFVGLVIPFVYVGMFAYHLEKRCGDALAFIHARDLNWGPGVWFSVKEVWEKESFDTHPEYFLYQPFLILPVLGTLLLFTRKKWLALAADSTVLMAVVLGSGGVAVGRYSAACWPAFLPLGVWLARKPLLQGPVIGALMLIQGIFFWLFSHQFRIL